MWKNGSFNHRVGGGGIQQQSPKGNTIECAVHFQFTMTNNEVEYEVVLSGLDLAKATRAMSMVIHFNSQVVVRHISGDYEAKGEWMKKYLHMVKDKMSKGFSAKFVQIQREENKHVDRLAKAASTEHMNATN